MELAGGTSVGNGRRGMDRGLASGGRARIGTSGAHSKRTHSDGSLDPPSRGQQARRG